ncbi:hypothetical protein [Pseudalkalibacillus salsuginis]|uniref:hypothetical protein n=1 Tax=Pseudalkalibacillus salsuginis TaxID=2910972 RepID=UPI001F263814|nr:hypothetical protein [Pseudalkalibacillus salsuginis]MCF6410200.1 hypothetical protein [Pseudalkalibacillus salsuginis]
MNDYLSEMLAREIVEALPGYKRDLYKFIVGLEDSLAQQSDTADQFMTLMKKHSPLHQAAKYFRRSVKETDQLMKEIEKEIDTELSLQLQHIDWLDCSDVIRKRRRNDKQAAFLLYMNPKKVH